MKQVQNAGRNRNWLPVVVLLIGALLVVMALRRASAPEPPGWAAIDGQVALALDAIEQGKEPPAADVGTGTAAQQDQAAGSAADTATGSPGGTKEAPQQGAGSPSAGGQDSDGQSGSAASGAAGQSGGKLGDATASGSPADAAGQAPAGSGISTDAAGQAPAGSGALAGTAGQTPASGVSADGRIDINHASAQELDELPGIGEAKAKSIVEDREKNGFFRSADDLLRVKGIGPKMLEKIKTSIVVNP